MTSQIFLIRHAAHSHLGQVLSGRAGEIPLSAEGQAQAARLAHALRSEPLDEVQTSPVLRARETAEAIALSRDVPVTVVEALDEVAFGEWEGAHFSDLEGDPRWRRWNEEREHASAPGGEAMSAVQQRIAAHIKQVAEGAAGKAVAMVSHCDVIRAAVAAIIGLPLGKLLQFDVDPASVTRVVAGNWGSRLASLNERVA